MLELDPEMLNSIKKKIKKNEKFLKLFVIIKSKPYPWILSTDKQNDLVTNLTSTQLWKMLLIK